MGRTPPGLMSSRASQKAEARSACLAITLGTAAVVACVVLLLTWMGPKMQHVQTDADVVLSVDEARLVRRASAAVLGAFVADAASMGLHWVYNQSEVLDLLARRGSSAASPEFLNPPASKYYDYATGAFSPYGEELLPMLRYLAAERVFDKGDWSSFLAAHYERYEAAGGRLNKSSKSMAARVAAGATGPDAGDPDDDQANALVKLPALVARFAGRPGLTRAVREAVSAQQNNDRARDAAAAVALVMEKVVLGAAVTDALQWATTYAQVARSRARHAPPLLSERVQASLSAALEQAGRASRARAGAAAGLLELAQANGLSCKLPGAMVNAVAAAALAQPLARAGHGGAAADRGEGDVGGGAGGEAAAAQARFRAAVRANMLAGGDSCSRAVVIGALLAAEGGEDSIPPEWIAQTAGYQEVKELTKQMMIQRKLAKPMIAADS